MNKKLGYQEMVGGCKERGCGDAEGDGQEQERYVLPERLLPGSPGALTLKSAQPDTSLPKPDLR